MQIDIVPQSHPQFETSQEESHAHLVQFLSTIMVQVNALQALLRDDAGGHQSRPYTPDLASIRSGLAVLEQLTREMLYDLRSTNDDMPLEELSGVTLPEALTSLVEETAEKLGLSSRIMFSGEERPLPASLERLLYRIAHEALYAVEQHTGAHRLRFAFNYGRDEVQMSIEDDGVAFEADSLEAPDDEEQPAPPFVPASQQIDTVLSSLHHRIEHLGGSLMVSKSAEQGTLVQAKVPYIVTAQQAQPAPSGGLTPEVAQAQDSRVRVLVVDSQAVTRAGLRRLLESYPGLEVVGEAADGVQAVSETVELGPQVVLMDTQLPNGQSLEALRQIKQLNLDTKVLLLSTLDREEYLYETLRAGADGYVLKDIAPDELAAAVRTVARGEVLVQPQIAGRLLSRFGRQNRGNYPSEALTLREQEVLHLLARGLRNKEIAARLYVSERTVNFHLANIYQKLNVSGRTEALSKALEQGLLTA